MLCNHITGHFCHHSYKIIMLTSNLKHVLHDLHARHIRKMERSDILSAVSQEAIDRGAARRCTHANRTRAHNIGKSNNAML